MNTTTATSEAQAELEEIVRAIVEKRRVDPETAKRVEERSAKLREEFHAKYGVVNIAVDLVREARDE